MKSPNKRHLLLVAKSEERLRMDLCWRALIESVEGGEGGVTVSFRRFVSCQVDGIWKDGKRICASTSDILFMIGEMDLKSVKLEVNQMKRNGFMNDSQYSYNFFFLCIALRFLLFLFIYLFISIYVGWSTETKEKNCK